MPQITSISAITNASDTLLNYRADPTNPIDPFRQKNLVYGYNGSGKTTLSRIFSYLGSGIVPDGLRPDFDFKIALSDDSTITRKSDLSASPLRLAVYNEDYRENHFKWRQGTAGPIFGFDTNVDVQNELTKLREVLAGQVSAERSANTDVQSAKKALDNFRTQTASHISKDAHFVRPSYTASRLDADYAKLPTGEQNLLDDDTFDAYRSTVATTDIPQPLASDVMSSESIVELLQRRILPTLARTAEQIRLPELDIHNSMSPWIETGYHYHQHNELNDCLFCGQPLTPERLRQITLHFSKTVNEIATHTRELVAKVSKLKQEYSRPPFPDPIQLAPTLRSKYLNIRDGYFTTIATDAIALLDQIAAVLDDKLGRPASAISVTDDNLLSNLETWQQRRDNVSREYQLLIAEQNRAAADFKTSQASAQEAIKRHILAETRDTHEHLSGALQLANDNLRKATADKTGSQSRIAELEATLKQHAGASPALNDEVNSFLRHKGIKLVVVDDGYQLQRADGTPVSHLSEGEKTAITFCHFLTSLPMKERDLKNLIVVIDDPISSLDTRALFYMAALARRRLNQAHQLFVFTHNMAFLSEIRKWFQPVIHAKKDDKAAPPPKASFHQLNVHLSPDASTRFARLENMSPLLRDYEGEYHYLFSLVYRYSQQADPFSEQLLLLPNAIRKVMETFLAFKAPSSRNVTSALDSLLSDMKVKPTITALSHFIAAERLSATEGHGEDLSALSSPAIATIEQTHSAAQELMSFIDALDQLHYKKMRKLSA